MDVHDHITKAHTHSVGPPTIPSQQVIVRMAVARKRQHRDGAAAERHSHCDDAARCSHVRTTTERAHDPLRYKAAVVASSARSGVGGIVRLGQPRPILQPGRGYHANPNRALEGALAQLRLPSSSCVSAMRRASRQH
jgi:hypothetical protein